MEGHSPFSFSWKGGPQTCQGRATVGETPSAGLSPQTSASSIHSSSGSPRGTGARQVSPECLSLGLRAEKLADVSTCLPPSSPAELSCQCPVTPSSLTHILDFIGSFIVSSHPPNIFLSVGIFLREAGTGGGGRAGLKAGGGSAPALGSEDPTHHPLSQEQSRSKGRGGECPGEARTPQPFKPFCRPPRCRVRGHGVRI